MSAYDLIVMKIIKEQELLMGPVAWYEAEKVKGLNIIDRTTGKIEIKGDSHKVIDNLVEQYGTLFGRAAREVCKEAVTAVIADLSPAEIPSSLK